MSTPPENNFQQHYSQQQYPHPPQAGQQYPGQPNYPYPPYPGAVPVKSHAAAILLSFFFGILGVDRFYLGHVGLGIAKLLLGWATFGVWPLVDFILIIVKGTPGLKRIHWT